MLPVSVVIVTKNEETNIEDALKSVSGAQEIIVVDSYSTDGTVEICKKYTEKVYQYEWEGFASQKQKAVDHAEGPWVLILDADERVTAELRSEIMQRVNLPDCSGYFMPRENYFIGKLIRHGGWWPDHTLRLFRKDKGRLENREVHERVVVEGPTGFLKNPLKHYSYRSISEFVERTELYSTLGAREIRKNARKGGVISLTVRPLATFVKMFVLRRGFLDGIYGLMLAVLYSYYTFLKYAKALEIKDRESAGAEDRT